MHSEDRFSFLEGYVGWRNENPKVKSQISKRWHMNTSHISQLSIFFICNVVYLQCSLYEFCKIISVIVPPVNHKLKKNITLVSISLKPLSPLDQSHIDILWSGASSTATNKPPPSCKVNIQVYIFISIFGLIYF